MMSRFPSEFLADIPPRISAAGAPATEAELALGAALRRKFLIEGQPEPFLGDVVRAFRLLKGMSAYMEIGTQDKGNLAYVSELLSTRAVLVDVDLEANPKHQAMLRGHARGTQTIHTIVGDSGAEETHRKIVAALGGTPLDAIFIDGNHSALYHLTDYAVYSRMVKPGGLIFMHDVYWDGDAYNKGSAEATLHIDRVNPVYVVEGADGPVHRFCPPMTRGEHWGRVGIIIKGE